MRKKRNASNIPFKFAKQQGKVEKLNITLKSVLLTCSNTKAGVRDCMGEGAASINFRD